MTRNTSRTTLPSVDLELEQLWYVPDRRLRTKTSKEEAVRIVDQIRAGADQADVGDEQALFVALHTCAYQASRRGLKDFQRNRWLERWRVVRGYLVEKNLGLAHSMVGRFGTRQVDEDDLLSDALHSLMRAVDRFNPWMGFRFSTYACNVIMRALMRRGKRESRYRRLFPVQDDHPIDRAEPLPDFETELYVERLQHVLDGNLGELTDLESHILTQRFPMNRTARPTLQQIGQIVGLSKERVRQIQKVALRKLRSALEQDPMLQ
jgi:RNA polymerase sigma factor (sigma-70 family)